MVVFDAGHELVDTFRLTLGNGLHLESTVGHVSASQ